MGVFSRRQESSLDRSAERCGCGALTALVDKELQKLLTRQEIRGAGCQRIRPARVTRIHRTHVRSRGGAGEWTTSPPVGSACSACASGREPMPTRAAAAPHPRRASSDRVARFAKGRFRRSCRHGTQRRNFHPFAMSQSVGVAWRGPRWHDPPGRAPLDAAVEVRHPAPTDSRALEYLEDHHAMRHVPIIQPNETGRGRPGYTRFAIQHCGLRSQTQDLRPDSQHSEHGPNHARTFPAGPFARQSGEHCQTDRAQTWRPGQSRAADGTKLTTHASRSALASDKLPPIVRPGRARRFRSPAPRRQWWHADGGTPRVARPSGACFCRCGLRR